MMWLKKESAVLVLVFLFRVINWRSKRDIFSGLGFAVFELKVLRARCNVCLSLQITSDCTGIEYCKPCTFAK